MSFALLASLTMRISNILNNGTVNRKTPLSAGTTIFLKYKSTARAGRGMTTVCAFPYILKTKTTIATNTAMIIVNNILI